MTHQTHQTQFADISPLADPQPLNFDTGLPVTFLDRSTLTLPPMPRFDPVLNNWICPETGNVGDTILAAELIERIKLSPSLFGEQVTICLEDSFAEGAFHSEIATDILSGMYRQGILLGDPENFQKAIEETFPKILVTNTDEGLIALVPVPATDRGDVCGDFTGTDYEFIAAIDPSRPFKIHLSVDKTGRVVWRKGHKSQGRGVIRNEDEALIENEITYAERARLRNDMSSTFFSDYYQEAIQAVFDALLASGIEEPRAGTSVA